MAGFKIGPVKFTTDAHPLGQAFSPDAQKTNSIKEQVGLGGGGGAPKDAKQEGGWSGNFHADDLINEYYTGLSDQQRTYIRNQLANQGISEHSQKADFVKGLQSLGESIPGLKAKSAATSLFPDQSSSAGWDPMALNALFSTVAPYLANIQKQTQSIVSPLYQQAASHIPHIAGTEGMAAMLKAMQGGEANLQGALGASAMAAPGLDALMQNVTSARNAAQKDFYEQERAAAVGGAGGTGGLDLSGLTALLSGKSS